MDSFLYKTFKTAPELVSLCIEAIVFLWEPDWGSCAEL